MSDTRVDDLLSLDRDVARAAKALARWRSQLARDPGAHADEDPIEPVRRAAGKATWDALRDLAPTLADGPLRDALLPWVAALTMARAHARGRRRLGPRRRRRARAVRRGAAAARRLARGVAGRRGGEDAGRGRAVAGRGGASWARRSRRWRGRAPRSEGRSRGAWGYAHPWEPLGVGTPAVVCAEARRLLDATEDLSRAVWKGARGGAAEVLHGAVGREAGDGWPAHLVQRWLEEGFGAALAGLRVELPPLPAAARRRRASPAPCRTSASRRGSRRRRRRCPSPSRGRPARARRTGWGSSSGGSRRTSSGRCAPWASGVARRCARPASSRARPCSTRASTPRALLLGGAATHAPRDLFEELGPRLFGAPLDPRLRGAWPLTRDDEPARFVALVDARAFAGALRDRFDADWFRNPRAWAHVRAISAVPAAEPFDAAVLASGVDLLARAFEGALG